MNVPSPKLRLGCSFFKAKSGVEPVRVWFRSLTKAVRLAIGSDVERVQWRWPVSGPLVGGFGEGLYEVRTSLDGNIFRVFFTVEGPSMVLLHGFMKKTEQTPAREVAIARARQKEAKS